MQIWKQYNKKLRRDEWRARFRLNGKQFRPKAATKEKLDTLVREIHNQEAIQQNNKKYKLKLEVVSYIPTIGEVFENSLTTIHEHNKKVFTKRVFETFASLLPPAIKATELRKTHFQLYLNFRLGQIGKQTKQPIRRQTALKELYCVTAALNSAILYYDSLENWQVPSIPEPPRGFNKKNKRQRLVTDKELSDVISALMKEPEGKQSRADHLHRVRLAHTLEFQFWTGLRRKEIARLKFSQYDESKQALLNVKRFKTESITKYLPLGKRAVEIISIRRDLQGDSDYIFTPDGEPIESNYRTLRRICENLKIPYGRYKDNGFIAHDLRHNFGTDILRETDIETARELLGHSNITQTGSYVHTDADRMRQAVLRRDKIDYDAELRKVFNEVKAGEIEEMEFNEKIKKLFRF